MFQLFFFPKNDLPEEFKSYLSFDWKNQRDPIENIKQCLEGGWTSNCRKPIEN